MSAEASYKPGDIGFARTVGKMGLLIRWGEWLKMRKSHFNHVFILDRFEGGVWYVIQAEIKGVTKTRSLAEVAPGGEFVIVPPPKGARDFDILDFARHQVGSKYGWYTIASIALDILTPDWFPAFRRGGTWICSALGAESLRYGGWLYEWGDIYVITPEQLYCAIVAPDPGMTLPAL
jgi:hypothetical protein